MPNRAARSVLVTGAARGIGLAIAERFRADGAAVLAPTRAELDLESTESIARFVREHADVRIDVLVNNAGINPLGTISELGLADWQRTLAVNLTAPFLLLQAFAPGMASRGWGRIVNISSCYGLVGRIGRAAYSSAKSGLGGLTRAAALEFAAGGVLVNAVCPGFTATELTHRNNTPEQIARLLSQVPLGRLASPTEIAEQVLFLASDANTYLTGQMIAVDGGFVIQ